MGIFNWAMKRSTQVQVRSSLSAAEVAAGWPTLADVPSGVKTRVASFAAGIAPDRKAQLQAYGVTVGQWVVVSQHSPVTVVQVEHTELAIESALAAGIMVEKGS